MLMTKMKPLKELATLIHGNVLFVTCHGCKEVNTGNAETRAEAVIRELGVHCETIGLVTADYICNPEFLDARFGKYAEQIEKADAILVFSCGVGVQTIADAFPHKRVYAANNTFPLPGFQGVTPQEADCGQCGQCYLNLTGGICPITACSKSLINGQCGGAKDGKCEVDPNMECGWERIQRRLAQLGRLDVLKCPIQLRNYATEDNLK